MRINVEFESLEEMDRFCNSVAVGLGPVKKATPVEAAKVSITKGANATKNADPIQEETPAADKEELPSNEDKPTKDAPTYTLEDVRACLGALTKAGKREQVKQLLQDFGAVKLPEVSPDDYPALMAKAGELDAQ